MHYKTASKIGMTRLLHVFVFSLQTSFICWLAIYIILRFYTPKNVSSIFGTHTYTYIAESSNTYVCTWRVE